MHTISDKKVLMLKPEQIFPSPYQPRRNFDEFELNSLAESIAENGVIQPLTVRKRGGGTYELIAGERRLRASKIAGLRRIPCILHNTDNISASIYCLTENLQRSDLNFFETAKAIENLLQSTKLSQNEIAVRLGINKSTLCNKLRILRLDDTQKRRILSSNLTERHARILLQVPPDMRDRLLDTIIDGGLNVRQTQAAAERLLYGREEKQLPPAEFKKEKPIRKASISDERIFANSLTKLVETLNSGGIDAVSTRNETKKYIEYKVRIDKEIEPQCDRQLKIC
ncbi:MAG: ParB/RepB/Spo0J family partition protein [Clostridia bacterium]|nr:ParB/RepB/Spo0J family partition protein [Clostridia bacterium]